jgi:hypothetical protein
MSEHKSHKVELDRDLRDLFDGSTTEDFRACQVETTKRKAHRVIYMRDVLGMRWSEIGKAINRSGTRVQQLYYKEKYRGDRYPSPIRRYINPDFAAMQSALEIRDALSKNTGISQGGPLGYSQTRKAQQFVAKLRMKALMKALGNPRIHDRRDWIDLGD